MSAFTCPVCAATSHHPDDVKHGYCGRCHAFTRTAVAGEPLNVDDMKRVRAELHAAVVASITSGDGENTVSDPKIAASYVVNRLTQYQEGRRLLAAAAALFGQIP